MGDERRFWGSVMEWGGWGWLRVSFFLDGVFLRIVFSFCLLLCSSILYSV